MADIIHVVCNVVHLDSTQTKFYIHNIIFKLLR